MIGAQKFIKYCAIAFAMAIIFGIVSSIVYGISAATGIINNVAEVDTDIKDDTKLEVPEDFKVLDINIKAANLIIKTGDELEAHTSSEYIECRTTFDKLYIREKKHFNIGKDTKIVVYIPSDMILDKASIKTGAGKVSIENLSTDVLDLDLGAGKVDIKNLNVFKETNIDGGAGAFTIDNGNITNLSLDMGVGKVGLNLILKGYTKIDAGVGKIALNLLDTIDSYKFILDKGIGAITINGMDFKDGSSYGNGTNVIDIDGGVGKIEINTKID